MAITDMQFREDFPAFVDINQFPPAVVSFWLGVAYKVHNAFRWGDLLDTGVELFTAHNLAMDAISMKAGASGGPGAVVGPLSAGAVDKVSYSRNLAGVLDPNDGQWNLTTYGMRWRYLSKMAGTGPVQVGVPSPCELGPAMGWSGPILTPPW